MLRTSLYLWYNWEMDILKLLNYITKIIFKVSRKIQIIDKFHHLTGRKLI